MDKADKPKKYDKFTIITDLECPWELAPQEYKPFQEFCQSYSPIGKQGH